MFSAFNRKYIIVVMFLMSYGTAVAGNFITIAEVTINMDRVEYIEPIFCTSTPSFDIEAQKPDLTKMFGECQFNVVFGTGEMKLNLTQRGYSAEYGAKEKVGFARDFGPLSDVKTKEDAEKQVRALRGQLPS